MLQLAVILPTFNERANIARMVERIDAAFSAERIRPLAAINLGEL